MMTMSLPDYRARRWLQCVVRHGMTGGGGGDVDAGSNVVEVVVEMEWRATMVMVNITV